MKRHTNVIGNETLRRILLVRLRSIGDTVLMTPCLTALKAWQPAVEIDVLVESLSAPVLRAHPQVTRLFVLSSATTQLAKLTSRLQIIKELRARHYDIAFNLHGGTTATFLTRAAGARVTVGYAANPYASLLSWRAPNPQTIWQKQHIHCVEQQLALLKWAGVPISLPPQLSLAVEPSADQSIINRLAEKSIGPAFAVVHPAAAFPSKQWEAARFARAIEHLYEQHQLPAIVVVAAHEAAIGEAVVSQTRCPVTSFQDLDLSQLMALIARASLFLGNDSGPAHIATAFGKPVVVIYGSSNAQVWHPWSKVAYRLLRAELPCAPCPGYTCREFPEPECIKRVYVNEVITALDQLITDQLSQRRSLM
ncbi:MAG: glycosyltransferase family 9 protein [Acidobacteriota bacterium]